MEALIPQIKTQEFPQVCFRSVCCSSSLLRLCYTSPRAPHKVVIHYLGDPKGLAATAQGAGDSVDVLNRDALYTIRWAWESDFCYH